jgi:hypothetical protein
MEYEAMFATERYDRVWVGSALMTGSNIMDTQGYKLPENHMA